MAKTREAKPGELRGITMMERMERLSRRAESRIDLQNMLGKLSPDGQTYARHLVMSGPMADKAAAKECGFTAEQFEAAVDELEQALEKLK